jgi:protein tyrosine phosphatase
VVHGIDFSVIIHHKTITGVLKEFKSSSPVADNIAHDKHAAKTKRCKLCGLLCVKGSRSNNLTHYHFVAWPDFGVPSDMDGFLNFVVALRNEEPLFRAPCLVHCRQVQLFHRM